MKNEKLKQVLASAVCMALVSNAPAGTLSTPSGSTNDAFNSIQHIVVIYQENWTFDGLYGSFPGANGLSNASTPSQTQIDRLTGNSLSSEVGSLPYLNADYATGPSGSPTSVTPPPPLAADSANSGYDPNYPSNGTLNTLVPWSLANYINPSILTGDIYHRYWQEQFQINGTTTVPNGNAGSTNPNTAPAGQTDGAAGNNSGFVTWCDDPGLTMSHFDATNLPEGLLAQQYTICDNYFHSAFGGSFLNHQFLVAAQAPVYANMPTSNNSNIAWLDSKGVFVMNTSGTPLTTNFGRYVRDGSITPVAGDVISVAVNQGSTQSLTLTAANCQPYNGNAFSPAVTQFGQHYVVNTTRSINLPSGSDSYPAVSLMPSLNDSASTGDPRPYDPTIGDLLSQANVSWKWYSGGWAMMAYYSKANNGNGGTANTSYAANPLYSAAPGTGGDSSEVGLGYNGGTNTGYTGSYTNDNNTFQFQYHHQPLAFYDNYAPFGSATVPSQYVGGFAGVLPSGVTAGAHGIAINQATNSAAHLQDELAFFADVNSGNLPAVSFIKPVGVDNEHPGYCTLQQGQAHVASILQALQSNPALWATTAVIITYDEHGGRWDHVTPPLRDIWGPGERVPAIIISPLVKQGFVDGTQYETSSILSTIEQRFLAPGTHLTSLDANATSFYNDFTELQVSRGGLSYNRKTGIYSQPVTLTNVGAATVTGPEYLILSNLPGTATLVNATATDGNGHPYVAFSSNLAVGASVAYTLQFSVTSGGVTYTASTASGGSATP